MNEFKQWIHGIAELLAGPSQKYQDLDLQYDREAVELRKKAYDLESELTRVREINYEVCEHIKSLQLKKELLDMEGKGLKARLENSMKANDEMEARISELINMEEENKELKGTLSSAMESLAEYKELFLNNKIVFEARNK